MPPLVEAKEVKRALETPYGDQILDIVAEKTLETVIRGGGFKG